MYRRKLLFYQAVFQLAKNTCERAPCLSSSSCPPLHPWCPYLYSSIHIVILCTAKKTTIWSWGWGGGWQIWSGQIIYFHHGLGWQIYFRVNRGQNIYFQRQQHFEKAKKRGEERGLVRGFSRGGRTWLSFVLHNFLQKY